MNHARYMLGQLANTLGTMVFDQRSVLDVIERVNTNGSGMQHFPEHGLDQFTVFAMLHRVVDEFGLLVVIYRGQVRQSRLQLTLTTVDGVSVSQPTREGQPLFKLGTTPKILIGAHLDLVVPSS